MQERITGSLATTETGFRRLATAAAFVSLFAYSVLQFVTPSAINEIGKAFNISQSTLGGLYFTFAASFCVSVIYGGRISDRKGKLPVVAAGCIFITAGSTVFALTHNLVVAFAANLLMGFGGGLAEGIAMATISDLYNGPRRTAMLNWSQFVFAVGAILTSLGISALIAAGISWRVGFMGAAVLCAVAAFLAVWATVIRYEKPLAVAHGESNWREVLFDPIVFWLSIGLMLYVGAECGLTNWLAVFFKEDLATSSAFAASTVAFMWLGLGVGRAAATWISRRWTDINIIRWGLALAAVSQAALLLVNSPIAALAIVTVIGFALGPMWPTILSCVGAAHPNRTGTVFGVVIAMGSFGNAIFTPAIGRLGDSVGTGYALWLCFSLLVINFVIFSMLRAGEKKRKVSR